MQSLRLLQHKSKSHGNLRTSAKFIPNDFYMRSSDDSMLPSSSSSTTISPTTYDINTSNLCDLISILPEEILLYVLSLLDINDLQASCMVSSVWRRLCEDEFIYRTVCAKRYPCLAADIKPPYELSWSSYYKTRQNRFAVIGGPISQASCMEDITGKLRAAGIVNIEPIYAQKRIPTLAELQRYAGVLVYSYNSSAFLDGGLMGDVLADYIDNGGGVVISVFTNCNNLRNGFIKGRFLDGNYHPIMPARQHDTNGKRPLTLGRIHEPMHNIMSNVKSLDGGKSSFFCPGALQPEAKLIADWSNGVPLVVELQKKLGQVVALNFFPPSCDTGDPRFWQSNTDGGLLMANALAHVGRSSCLKKRRAKRSYSESRKAESIETERMVRDAQGNWVQEKRTLVHSHTCPDLHIIDPSSVSKKKKTLSAKIFGKKLFAKWLSFKKPETE